MTDEFGLRGWGGLGQGQRKNAPVGTVIKLLESTRKGLVAVRESYCMRRTGGGLEACGLVRGTCCASRRPGRRGRKGRDGESKSKREDHRGGAPEGGEVQNAQLS